MQHVLITGANRGIGAEMAQQMRDAGLSVTGTHRAAATPNMLTLDVTDPASVASMARAYGDRPLDLLVCNAGVYHDKGATLADYPAADWDATFAANVTGVFLTIQALLPQLRQSRGKIAIISSQMGSSTKASGTSLIYRASKAAALNLGLNLATALRGDGIAVGIYHPGWVQTDMGGTAADLTPAASAKGLIDRFQALSLATTGCFENWDGRPHPI